MLKEVSIGWHWLEKTLNEIIGEINTNKPLASSTIMVEANPGGSILRTVSKENNQPGNPQSGGGGGGSGPTGGQWIPVNVIDANCKKSVIYVWGKYS